MDDREARQETIQENIPAMVYRDLYKAKVQERLQHNDSYKQLREQFTTLAKGFMAVLEYEDEHPTAPEDFERRKDAYVKTMELMRELANFEAAELMMIIREEYGDQKRRLTQDESL